MIFKTICGLLFSVALTTQGYSRPIQGRLEVQETNSMYSAHRKEGNIWTDLEFYVNPDQKMVRLMSIRPMDPVASNSLEATLIVEYYTKSGKVYTVHAVSPWLGISAALIPTDEDGKGFKVYSQDGTLLGEYWVVASTLEGFDKSPVARAMTAGELELGLTGQGKIGFPGLKKSVYHLDEKNEYNNQVPRTEDPQFFLRHSLDNGKSWSKLAYGGYPGLPSWSSPLYGASGKPGNLLFELIIVDNLSLHVIKKHYSL